MNFIFLCVSILSLLGIWIYGFLTPVLLDIDNSFLQFLFARTYSTMCHQDSARCITIGNEHLLVCARCAGIYFGAFITCLINLFRKPIHIDKKIFIFMSLPMLLDIISVLMGLYQYSKIVASLTGLIFGSFLLLLIISELEDYLFIKKVLKNE